MEALLGAGRECLQSRIRSSSRSPARKASAVAAAQLREVSVFGTQHAAVNWVGISLGVAQNIAGVLDPDVISIGSDPPLNIVSPYDPFNLLAGLFQGGITSIPWFDITHTSRKAHPAYCGVQGICGAIVTQQGHITLAEDDEEDGGDPGIDSEREGQARRDITESEQGQAPSNAAAKGSPADFQSTLDRIFRGESFPTRNDGSVFRNDRGLLSSRPEGYYHEYVHPTPGVSGAGAERLVVGQDGEVYYTPDHYKTFIRLR